MPGLAQLAVNLHGDGSMNAFLPPAAWGMIVAFLAAYAFVVLLLKQKGHPLIVLMVAMVFFFLWYHWITPLTSGIHLPKF
jgi:hypothetical protein